MKYVIYIYFICIFQSVCHAQSNNDKWYFHGEQSLPNDTVFLSDLMWILDNSYYNHFYEYPDSLKQVKGFIDSFTQLYESDREISNAYDWFCMFSCKAYLERNINDVSLMKDDSTLIFTNHRKNISDTILIRNRNMHPCDMDRFTGKETMDVRRFYERFRNPRFFDIENRVLIISNGLDSVFKSDIMELGKKYLKPYPYHSFKYSKSKNRILVFTFLEYRMGQSMRYFCERKRVIPDLSYYRKLEIYLKDFCLKNQLSRIIFMTPDYY